jgi:hypothetical protein
MKSLFFTPDDSVFVIDLGSMDDLHGLIGNFDLVGLGNNLLMAIKSTALPVGLIPNRRATLFLANMLDVFFPISGSAIVFMDTSEDLDLKTLPDWVQRAIAAPFN